MPILRSLVKQAPAIAISAAVLVLAAGAGVSFATTSADSASGTSAGHDAAGTLTWHRLQDGPGWHGTIKYAVSNGVVYLSGIERVRCAGKNCTPFSETMTTLPAGARPTSPQLVMPVAMNNGAGTISILRNGQITPDTGGFNFVSLSGVSFGLGS
jgi:hypothetical protein